MNAPTGQILRFLGMAVEAGSLIGLLRVWNGETAPWDRLGVDPSLVLGTTFLTGIGIWIAGIQTIRKARLRERNAPN